MFKDFIKELSSKQIQISFENGKIQYKGPEHYIDGALIANLKKYKPQLVKYFWPEECKNMMPITTSGKKTPVILLHAGKAIYPIKEFLGDDQPLYGFFDEGSEGEKIVHKTVGEFAEAYMSQIIQVIPDGPYILGGLSFGGTLAYEIAIRLQKIGKEVPFLILGDCELYHHRKQAEKSNLPRFILKQGYHKLKNLVNWIKYEVSRRVLNSIYKLLKKPLPPIYRKSYIIWTYFKLTRKYKPNEVFKGKILLFRSETNDSPNELLGWDQMAESISFISLPGNHQAMYDSKETTDIMKKEIAALINS